MMHYYRIKRGYPLHLHNRYDSRPAILEEGIAKIPLNRDAKDGYAIVDVEYAHLAQHKWYLGKRGYPIAHIKGKTVYLHRMIMPSLPDGLMTDHEDRNRLNNRRSNLRAVTSQSNNRNRSMTNRNTSGHVGVTFFSRRNKWQAQIVINKRCKFLGYFDSKEDAIEARLEGEQKYFK